VPRKTPNVTVTEAPGPAGKGSPLEVFVAFLRLGLTSFGGPIAHLGYFRQEFVARRHWLDEAAYADLVALCQFLPGPASSEVGIGIGLNRAGLAGALAAWTGFTLPSAIALVLFALGVERFGSLDAAWLHGLKIAAVAVVAQAVWGMASTMATGRTRATLAVAAAAMVLAVPTTAGQLSAITLGAAAGMVLLRTERAPSPSALGASVGRGFAILCLAVFFALLAGLPLLAASFPNQALAMFNAFYRAGSLVFGGGHVVLPLLQAAVVPPGWVTNDAFLAGYGAAQAVPGPLFTFAAYLGGRHGPASERLGGCRDLPRRDLPAVVPAGDRRAAVLAGLARQAVRPIGIERCQCRRGRPAAGSALQSRVARRHHGTARFRGGARRVPPAHGVEDAALGGRGALRRGGRGTGRLKI
jgi:chromate transporter